MEITETTVTTVPSSRIRTPEVASHIGETVRVAGWLHSLRRPPKASPQTVI
jgi:hypothetical protein